MRLFELKREQEEALETLEWASNEMEVKELLSVMQKINGSISERIDYWLPLLKQAEYDLESAIEAKNAYLSAHESNIKRREKVKESIKNHILSMMIDFGVFKHKGALFNASHYMSPGSLYLSDTFDVKKLPDEYKKINIEPDKKAITDKLKSVDSGTEITKDISIPGCYLVKKEILRIS